MKVLLIKMSSLGDILHMFPAIDDAFREKGITFTWAIEPAFAPIALWHPAVSKTIETPLRAIRKNFINSVKDNTIQDMCKSIREDHYDYVIDAQGLIKSAMVAAFAKGPKVGFDKNSTREPLASYFYDKKICVPKGPHAITRLRGFMAELFDYKVTSPIHYGIRPPACDLGVNTFKASEKTVLFLHGTTWATKHWPESHWTNLASLAVKEGYTVLLPWGTTDEHARAERIKLHAKSESNKVHVLEQMSLEALASLMTTLDGVVSVDTGLGHLAAALNVPGVSLYGASNPVLTGALGSSQRHLQHLLPCSPCLKRDCAISSEPVPPCLELIKPERVWQELKNVMIEPKVKHA